MPIDSFASSVLEALAVVPSASTPIDIDPTKKRNAATAITSFLVERLRQKDAQVKKVRNTTFSWAGGES